MYTTEQLKSSSDAELQAANQQIVAELKRRQRAKCANAALEFGVGDEVEFTSQRDGRTVRGKITKMGLKNAFVRVDALTTWKVTLTLLRYASQPAKA